MNIKDILNILNCNKQADFIINNITTDSKKVKENDVFIAINSGHKYINEAIKNGAIAVITEDKKTYDCLTINVDSTIKALCEIATYLRNLYEIPLIAITGSNGKTTTKELISLILSSKYNILKSEKNKNNNIGVSMTLLDLNETYDVVVLELGMNHKGEISNLSKICKPNYGVITNIGTAHIGNLGSKKNVLKAKLEILDGMNKGCLIVNKDDKYLNRIKYKNTIKLNKEKLNVKNINYYFDRTEFDIEKTHFIFNVPGSHMLNDLLLAIGVGIMFGIDLKDMSEVISEFENVGGRLNIKKGDYTVIDDSYNSNYESLKNNLSILKNNDSYKIIILGDMLELGKYSKKYHKKINKCLNKIKNKEVLLIGEYTKYIKGKHFNSVKEINEYLKNKVKEKDIVYIKGSRAMKLDEIDI